MQIHPNGGMNAPGFRMDNVQLTLTDTILVTPKIGSDQFAKHWFNGKAYYSDENLRSDLVEAMKRLDYARANIHEAG